MTGKDDMNTDDRDLQSYLDGRDGVSAAYQNASAGEEPAPALDELILRAAHAHQAPRQKQAGLPLRSLFSMAASLLVGMAIGSVFLGNLELRDSSNTAAGPATGVATAEALAIGADMADMSEAVAESRPDPAPQQLLFPAPALNPAPEPARILTAGQTLPVSTANLRDPVQASAAERENGRRPPPATRQSATLTPRVYQSLGGLENITVTGSRIARPAATYRSSPAAWLLRITELRESATQAAAQANAALGELDAEEQLFRQTHPQLDLEQELSALTNAAAVEAAE